MERAPIESFLKREDIEKEEEVQIKFLRGKKGDKGDPGKDADPEEIAEMVIIPVSEILKEDKEFKESLRGEPGKNGIGRDGKDAEIDIVEITERVLNILPSQKAAEALKGDPGKDGSPDTPKEIIEKINKSRGSKIKRDKVEGLDEVESIARTSQRQVQNFISLGGARQTRIASNGTVVSTGATTINFTNATIAVPAGNDGSTVNVTTSGSGGSAFQVPTGTVDGSNTVFIFATAPNVIVVDQGRAMQATSSDGTVNWTGTTTVTLSIAPNFDIYAIA